MLAAFPPPTHLRSSPNAIESSLNIYRRALSRFERPILEMAWQKAAAENEYRIWPSCAAILKAAEHFNARFHPPPKNPDAWVSEAQGMADAYTKRFMKTTTVAVRAREGGYERKLKDYVEAAGWVQAELILGRRNISYTGSVLFQNGEEAEDREEWFERAKRQAKTGSIRVTVPNELVKKWKGESQGRSR